MTIAKKRDEMTADFKERFDIIEKLFKVYGLERKSEMDHHEIEALDIQREDLAKRKGWTKMSIPELREELRIS